MICTFCSRSPPPPQKKKIKIIYFKAILKIQKSFIKTLKILNKIIKSKGEKNGGF